AERPLELVLLEHGGIGAELQPVALHRTHVLELRVEEADGRDLTHGEERVVNVALVVRELRRDAIVEQRSVEDQLDFRGALRSELRVTDVARKERGNSAPAHRLPG